MTQAAARKPEGVHVGSFELADGGRCEVYTRHNRVTMFFARMGEHRAYHLKVPVAMDASQALARAAESTAYEDEAQHG